MGSSKKSGKKSGKFMVRELVGATAGGGKGLLTAFSMRPDGACQRGAGWTN
jgi:hypothetical protein